MDNLDLIIAISSKKIQEITGVPFVKSEQYITTVNHIARAVNEAERGLPRMKLNNIIIGEVIKYFTPSSTLLDDDIPETTVSAPEQRFDSPRTQMFTEDYEIMVTKETTDLGFIPDSIVIKSIGIYDNSYMIDETCNSFVLDGEDIFVQPGDYTPEQMADSIPSLGYDSVTRKFVFSTKVDFTVNNSICKKLGFYKKMYKKDEWAENCHNLYKHRYLKVSVNGVHFYIESIKSWKDIDCKIKSSDKIEVIVYTPNDDIIHLDFHVILKVSKVLRNV